MASSQADLSTTTTTRTTAKHPSRVVNRALRHIKPVYFCPICARLYDVQDPHIEKRDLEMHLINGHEEADIEEWLQDVERYVQLKQEIAEGRWPPEYERKS